MKKLETVEVHYCDGCGVKLGIEVNLKRAMEYKYALDIALNAKYKVLCSESIKANGVSVALDKLSESGNLELVYSILCKESQ